VCDFILDIVQNSVEAGASHVMLDLAEDDAELRVAVEDDGKGMNAEEKKKALDPFHTDGTKHLKRKVGLGIPFLVQAVEQAGGSWSIDSETGKGTRVGFSFPKESVDCPPLGDVPGLFLSAFCFPGSHEMRIRRERSPMHGDPGLEYEMLRSEIAEAVGGLERGSSLALLREYLDSQENG
jgi:hypothetical protein